MEVLQNRNHFKTRKIYFYELLIISIANNYQLLSIIYIFDSNLVWRIQLILILGLTIMLWVWGLFSLKCVLIDFTIPKSEPIFVYQKSLKLAFKTDVL